nr:MIT domain-containing protein 1-like [Onthophagus taurus]XP_022908030.1 MIT domain-containing protein 1-like [Onthophagus taurus]XP_022908031.1 MIT domain-containing protein 1-like [Onthophagus taurus]
MSFESVAATIIQRAVLLDTQKRYTESLVCYQEGIQILMKALKQSPEQKKTYLRGKIGEYMSRAEQIKLNINKLKDEGKYHEQINIGDNETGYGYETVFGRFLDGDVLNVIVEDPYIRLFHQCQNFLRFCELLVRKCKNLFSLTLITTKDNKSDQENWLISIQNDLLKYKVNLKVEYSTTLHDRQIMLSSGWIIKIGRGLDYFKPPENKFSLGVFDMDLRNCHETSINIFHSNHVRTS